MAIRTITAKPRTAGLSVTCAGFRLVTVAFPHDGRRGIARSDVSFPERPTPAERPTRARSHLRGGSANVRFGGRSVVRPVADLGQSRSVGLSLRRTARGPKAPFQLTHSRRFWSFLGQESPHLAQEELELVMVHPMPGFLHTQNAGVVEVCQPPVLGRVLRPTFHP